MNVLENAKAHFAARRAELKSVVVPEWNNATIWYKALTTKQKIAIYEGDPSLAELSVRIVIHRALKEDGTPMFRLLDRSDFINHVDPEITERIAVEMMKSDATQDEAEKK